MASDKKTRKAPGGGGLKTGLAQVSPGFKKNLVRSLFAAGVFVLLILLPEFYIRFGGLKTRVLQQVQEKFLSMELAVTYEGADLSAWRGLTLYHFKVARGDDFNQGRALLDAPRARFIPGLWELLFNKEPHIRLVRLEKATWIFPFAKKELHKKLYETGTALKNRPGDFEIELVDNIFEVIFEKSNYYKEYWSIAGINGSFEKKDEKAHAKFEFQDYPWGEGFFTYESRVCKECSTGGRYHFSIEELPVHRLSWFFEGYALKNGFASLDFDLQEPQNEHDWLIDGKLRLRQLQVESGEKIFYHLEDGNLAFEASGKSFQGPYHGKARGIWGSYPLELSFDGAMPGQFPEHAKVILEGPINTAVAWAIPGVGLLSGLRRGEIELVRDSKGYQIPFGEFHVVDGGAEFFAGSEFSLKFPVIDLKFKENTYELSLHLQKGESDLQALCRGEFIPIFRQTLLNVYDPREINSRRRYVEMLVFDGNYRGKLAFEKLNLRDFKPWIDALSEEYVQRRRQGTVEGWKESLLRERSWFQRFLAYPVFDYEISLKEWGDDVVHKKDWTGKLSLEQSELSFLLQSDSDEKENAEKIAFTWNVKNNYPNYKGEVDLNFPEPGYFSSFFISEELLKSFRDVHWTYSFSSGGERAADFFLNHRGNGYFEAAELALSRKIDDDIPVTWDRFTSYVRRSGARAWFSPVQALRQGYELNASGTWNFENEESEWNFYPSLRQRH